VEIKLHGDTFRKSLEHPSIVVSRTGKLFNLKENAYIEINPPKEDWYLTFTSPDTGKTSLLHRLVGECWVSNPSPETFTLINHKNGNKHDPHFGNLEWTDHSGNIRHAYEHGLRTEMQTLEVFDKVTQKWFKSKGLNKTAALIDLSPAQLSYHLKAKGWFENANFITQLSNLESRKVADRTLFPVGVFAKDIETGKVVIAENISRLSKTIGVPKSNIRRCIVKGKEYPSNGYLFSLDGEFPETWKDNHRTKKAVVYLHEDGRRVIAVSDREAQKLTGINAKRIVRMKKEGSSFKGWKVQTG